MGGVGESWDVGCKGNKTVLTLQLGIWVGGGVISKTGKNRETELGQRGENGGSYIKFTVGISDSWAYLHFSHKIDW